MAKLTHELLERYLDGELNPRKARQVERLLEETPESRQSLSELSQMGDLLRLMNQEALNDVSFDGFRDRVERGIRAEKGPTPVLSRLAVWLSEFFENRRPIWVPTLAAVGAMALAFLLLPVSPSPPVLTKPPSSEQGIQLHRAHAPLHSQIGAVDFGEMTGTRYSLRDDRGGTIGVVWINEDS